MDNWFNPLSFEDVKDAVYLEQEGSIEKRKDTMTVDIVIDIAREALWLIIKCSAPMLLVSLVIGLAVSIMQTVTSIQEQTLTFVPKMLGIFITLMIAGGWIMNNIVDFVRELFSMFGTYVSM